MPISPSHRSRMLWRADRNCFSTNENAASSSREKEKEGELATKISSNRGRIQGKRALRRIWKEFLIAGGTCTSLLDLMAGNLGVAMVCLHRKDGESEILSSRFWHKVFQRIRQFAQMGDQNSATPAQGAQMQQVLNAHPLIDARLADSFCVSSDSCLEHGVKKRKKKQTKKKHIMATLDWPTSRMAG
ncbi:uncharacterized protein BJX67DRAFT_267408 [Aspergillus lucknowensis]|uniref:Uncharacterized protein n=1 Tax=Aspergillus lucknowensis TaxID=176173 RepID=A0ABR4LEZ9_9EURO